MSTVSRTCWLLTIAAAVIAGFVRAECVSVGPDVVVRFWDAVSYGSVGETAAFSFGTDACNIGDEVLDWVGDTPEHPVIASAIYRLHEGTFEQVGMSWLKHGWAADQADRCGCGCTPAGDNQHLGVGCADAYSAVTNGMQQVMGPRAEVDPYTGLFPFPPTDWGESGDQVFRRLQVHHSDLEVTDTEEAGRYFAEVQFVSEHDSIHGNQFNNSSWQEVSMSGFDGAWTVSLSDPMGGTVGEPALRAWAETVPSVRITESRPAGDGAILVGALVTPAFEGWYRYEYAIQNVNAQRGVRSVELGLPLGVHVYEVGFHDIEYHSGEELDGTDWETTWTEDALRWHTEPFKVNPVANGLRWGTTYNYRFLSNVPPVDGLMVLQPFREGIQDAELVSTRVPSLAVDPCSLAASPCPADGTGDWQVDVEDLLLLLQWWGNCGDGTYRPPADSDGDCCVGVEDLLIVLSSWSMTCGFEGACCLADGTCVTTTSTSCEFQGGTWKGILTDCSIVDCSIPVGACCGEDGTCTEDLTEAACFLLGGTWWGGGSTCNSINCGIPIGADDCADAQLVEDGLYFIDTTKATTDGPDHEECETGGDGGQIGNDLWLRYEAVDSGVLTFTTCEEVGGWANYDTDLAIYDGVDCDNLLLLGCNDDDPDHPCGSKAGGWHSTVIVPVEAGNMYLLRIGGWQEGNVGNAWALVELE